MQFRPNVVQCPHCKNTVYVFESKIADAATYKRTYESEMAADRYELEKLAFGGDSPGETEPTTARRKKRGKDDSSSSDGAMSAVDVSSSSSEDSDYWDGLGTPSDLSSDGREAYEDWKEEKRIKVLYKDFVDEQEALEKQEYEKTVEIHKQGCSRLTADHRRFRRVRDSRRQP